jgi:hypothetical protein
MAVYPVPDGMEKSGTDLGLDSVKNFVEISTKSSMGIDLMNL